MENKYTTFEDFRNREITPKLVEDALNNLPFNYIKQSQKVFEEGVLSNIFSKTYSDQYIMEVRQRTAFNEEILLVLTFVGLKSKQSKSMFGDRKTKKVPSSKK